MFRREEPVEPTAQVADGRKPISILTNGVQASTFWPRSLPGVGQDAFVSVGVLEGPFSSNAQVCYGVLRTLEFVVKIKLLEGVKTG